jgi:cytosine/adenosine deaminase-related metal-dependent hydrolase
VFKRPVAKLSRENTLLSVPAPTGNRFLLRGGHLITVDGGLGDFVGDVLVADGRIADVERKITATDCEAVDASDFFVLPGFVDCHRHLWQTPLRHVGTDWDLPQMFVELFVRLAPRMSAQDVYAATLYGRLAALDAGITTLLDWAHIQNTPEHSDAGIDALRTAGGRSIFGHGQPGQDPKPWMVDSVLTHSHDIRRIRKDALASDDALVTLAMAARGPEFCTMDVVTADIALARELDIPVTMHIGMGKNGAEKHAIEKLHRHHLLGPDLTCLHCNNSTDYEFHLLAEHGGSVGVSACMAMTAAGFGLPATGRLMAQGLRPSLSTDSEMTASGDMFTEMRSAFTGERMIRNNDIPNGPDRPPITVRDVLKFATIDGARTVGLDDRVGSITPGKKADIILIHRSALNLAPALDPVAALVVGGHGGNVDAVLIEGRPMKWNGALLHDGVGAARRQLTELCERLRTDANADAVRR